LKKLVIFLPFNEHHLWLDFVFNELSSKYEIVLVQCAHKKQSSKSLVRQVFNFLDKRFLSKTNKNNKYTNQIILEADYLANYSEDGILVFFDKNRNKEEKSSCISFSVNYESAPVSEVLYAHHLKPNKDLELQIFQKNPNRVERSSLKTPANWSEISFELSLRHLRAQQAILLVELLNSADINSDLTPIEESENISFSDELKYYFKYSLQILSSILNKPTFSLAFKEGSEFSPIPSPKKTLWADPFLFEHGEREFLFFEAQKFGQKGEIYSAEVGDKKLYNIKECLVTDYHLSYPQTFEHKGRIYMLPETSENNTISLFQSHNFPSDWQLEKHLIENIKAVDSTLVHWNNIWWLFTNINKVDGLLSWDELHIYHNSGDLLTGDWIEHDKNPVISDPKKGRMGGSMIQKNGKLFRPAQNCYGSYGKSIGIYEVLKLSKTEYSEKLVEQVLPPGKRKYAGLHTYNQNRNHLVVDLKHKVSRF